MQLRSTELLALFGVSFAVMHCSPSAPCDETGSCPDTAEATGGTGRDSIVNHAGDGGGASKNECSSASDGDRCSDGNPCTVDDACAQGVCVAGALKVCPTKPAASCERDGRTRTYYAADGQCLPNGQCGDRQPTTEVCPNGCLAGNCIKATQIATGHDSTCALFETGNVRCWGANGFGELAQGTLAPSATPDETHDLDFGGQKIKSIGLGYHYGCALSEAGVVYCWGTAVDGRLGNNSTTNHIGDSLGETPIPIQLTLSNNVTVAQLSVGTRHACVRLSNDAIRCWGDNEYHEIGNGLAPVDQLTPGNASKDLVFDPPIIEVIAGDQTSCALLQGNRLRCWGRNGFFNLGYSFANSPDGYHPSGTIEELVDVNAPAGGFDQISIGGLHLCGLNAGSLRCWGTNNYGQLGHGIPAPTEVFGGPGETPELAPVLLTNVKQVVSGFQHSCALLTNGSVRCWGRNHAGQLGYGDTKNRIAPPTEDVPVGGSVEQISGRRYHTCAILATGAIRCWGKNDYDNCGYSASQNQLSPGGDVQMIGEE